MTIYAMDFDGTLCESCFPNIGEPIAENVELAKEINKCGDKLILWTCRTGKNLQNAIEWCDEQGIKFDAINEQLPEILNSFELDSRKIYADFYIDDKNYFLGGK